MVSVLFFFGARSRTGEYARPGRHWGSGSETSLRHLALEDLMWWFHISCGGFTSLSHSTNYDQEHMYKVFLRPSKGQVLNVLFVWVSVMEGGFLKPRDSLTNGDPDFISCCFYSEINKLFTYDFSTRCLESFCFFWSRNLVIYSESCDPRTTH